VYMLWVVVLAILLLRAEKKATFRERDGVQKK